MLEILIWSVFVGTLGVEAVAAGAIFGRWQLRAEQLEQEEELILSFNEVEENYSLPAQTPGQYGGREVIKNSDFKDWEYKIVRASSDLFRDATVFQKLCEEEAQAGWILLEKLDDRRVRFKRSSQMRSLIKPDTISFDPYRTQYGPVISWSSWITGIVAVVALLLPAYLGFVLVSNTLATSRGTLPSNDGISAPNSSDSENSTAP